MARTRTRARGTSVVVVRSGGTGRRIARVAGRVAGRVASRIAQEEKHTLVALGAAAFMGIAKRQGWNLPTIGGMHPALTFGAVAWAVGKFSKNEVARHLATGLLSVGLFDALAYTRETREQIDALLETQRSEEEAEGGSSSLGRGGLGQLGG